MNRAADVAAEMLKIERRWVELQRELESLTGSGTPEDARPRAEWDYDAYCKTLKFVREWVGGPITAQDLADSAGIDRECARERLNRLAQEHRLTRRRDDRGRISYVRCERFE